MAENTYSGPTIFRIVVGLFELWVTLIVLILAAAFVLSILGANADASFAQWVFARAETLMRPFNGLFDPIDITGNTSVQPSLLFAILVYAVIGAVLGGIGRRFA